MLKLCKTSGPVCSDRLVICHIYGEHNLIMTVMRMYHLLHQAGHYGLDHVGDQGN